MSSPRPSFFMPRLAVFCLCAAFAAAGCHGSGPKLYTVKGKVSVNGNPLKGGAIVFHPDAAKGNKAATGASGTIKDDGEYELATNGKPGIPLGWYKVTVTALAPMGQPGGSVADPTKDGGGGVAPLAAPSAAINPKFGDPATTTLSVEVVASPEPGRYDFSLTK